MTSVLNAVGLTCDVVGAVALMIGLFRHPRPLFPGWVSGPDETAQDEAFGIAGAVLLVAGFAGQLLPGFGVRAEASYRAAVVASGVTLVCATLLAFALYSVALHLRYRVARGWAESFMAESSSKGGYPWHFEFRPRRSPFRLWALVNDQTGDEPGKPSGK